MCAILGMYGGNSRKTYLYETRKKGVNWIHSDT